MSSKVTMKMIFQKVFLITLREGTFRNIVTIVTSLPEVMARWLALANRSRLIGGLGAIGRANTRALLASVQARHRLTKPLPWVRRSRSYVPFWQTVGEM